MKNVGDKRRMRNDRGAAAIMVSLALVFVLLGLSAFTLDFGAAYVSKRQLQTAVDAAALGAASVYAEGVAAVDAGPSGKCEALLANAALRAAAAEEAESLLMSNHVAAELMTVEPLCDSGNLVIEVGAKSSTEVGVGRLLTDADTISFARVAAATVSPATTGRNVRPYAICSEALPPKDSEGAHDVVQVRGPGSGHSGSDCAEAEAGGNWWFIDCPEDVDKGSPDVVAENLEHGCSEPITTVPGQPSGATPAELSYYLTQNCADSSDYSPFCLSGDTGNSSLQNKKVYEEWEGLLGQTLLLPVFCSDPTCAPDTVQGTGTNATYPVYSVVAATLCGYHVYDKASGYADTAAYPECTDDAFNASHATGDKKDDKDDVWLYLRRAHVTVPGDTANSECGLDDDCNEGLLRVRLTK